MSKRKREPRPGVGEKSASSAVKTKSRRAVAAGPGDTASALAPDLERIVEDERDRLMKAHSILSCVTLAMENDDGSHKPGPFYPGLIEMAMELLNESIKRLDDLDRAL
jgi:hypothetical protein